MLCYAVRWTARAQVLFKLSKGKCLLLKLDVSKCGLSDRDLEAVAQSIQAVPAVMELDIRGNPLTVQARGAPFE
jgi:hypothetical protein